MKREVCDNCGSGHVDLITFETDGELAVSVGVEGWRSQAIQLCGECRSYLQTAIVNVVESFRKVESLEVKMKERP